MNAPSARVVNFFIVLLFFVGLILTLRNFIEITTTILVAVSILMVPFLSIYLRPIPYKSFKPYGQRSWWKNVLIFGLLPLIIVFGLTFVLSLIFRP